MQSKLVQGNTYNCAAASFIRSEVSQVTSRRRLNWIFLLQISIFTPGETKTQKLLDLFSPTLLNREFHNV